MLDVHPPHEATHTWRDFFIHIGTIVVGLLIAIGLEQSVEALHRRHERADLRASLHHELEQMVYDSANVQQDAVPYAAWLQQLETAVDHAMQTGKPVGELPPVPYAKGDVPENPFYRAAKSSGQLDLLDEDEIAGYGELDGLITHDEAQTQDVIAGVANLMIAERKLSHAPATASTNALLSGLQDCVLRLEFAVELTDRDAGHIHGAAAAMLSGERDLKGIEAAERKPVSHK
jgi:hypothetical protein